AGRKAAFAPLSFAAFNTQLSTNNTSFKMAEITSAMVGKLREMTGAGLMECKKALVEAGGDMDKAVDILRKKGAASAAKKSSREANEGIIVQSIQPGARAGILVE